jgi:hypothetical protein
MLSSVSSDPELCCAWGYWTDYEFVASQTKDREGKREGERSLLGSDQFQLLMTEEVIEQKAEEADQNGSNNR